MKKIYSIIGILALAITANAQTQSRTAIKTAKTVTGNPINSVTTSTSTVLVPPSILGASSCTLTYYSGGADGYVTGTNDFGTLGDFGKGQEYSLSSYGLTTPANVTAAGVLFAYMTDGAVGSNVTVDVYGDNAGVPGTLLGSSIPVALSSIVTGTLTPFMFATPVALTDDKFYMIVNISGLDASQGDTIVVVQTDDGCVDNVDGGWDLWDDGTFIKFSDPDNWAFTSTDLAVMPQVTADITTGIKSKAITSVVSVSPNPSNGIFNVAFKSANSENTIVTVTNAIGQVVVNKNFNMSNETVSFDLSGQNNGVYFVTITNGNDKTTKKVVLNK